MRFFYVFVLSLFSFSAFSQKILLLERANRAQTTKMFVGERLHFRLAGEEDYWYDRTITDILPESNVLLLDNFPVKLKDIANLRVRRKPLSRITGNLLFTFGATLALATTVGRFAYNDRDLQLGKLYTASAITLGTGYFLSSRRTLKMDEKFRLRIVEIKF